MGDGLKRVDGHYGGVEVRWRGRRSGWRGGMLGGRLCGHSNKIPSGQVVGIETDEGAFWEVVLFGRLLSRIHRVCRNACVDGSCSESCAL